MTSIAGAHPLYDHPDAYAAAFGQPFEGELEVLRAVLSPAGGVPDGRVLSLGCGAARLEAPLSREGWRFLGVDASPAMVEAARAADPDGEYRVGRLEDEPAGDEAFAGVLAGLLALAYLPGPGAVESTLRWLRRRVAPGGAAAFDVPVARRPRRLQGIAERWQGPDGAACAFHYDDVVEEFPGGARLATRLEVESPAGRASRRADLLVLRPAAWRDLARRTGWGAPRFLAPFDPGRAWGCPPAGALRAVVALGTEHRRRSIPGNPIPVAAVQG